MSRVHLTHSPCGDSGPPANGIGAYEAAGSSPRRHEHARAQEPKRDPQIDAALERARESLKRLRAKRNVSISKWEDDAGLGQGTLGKFIRGVAPKPNAGTGRTRRGRDIGLEALLRLARAQNVTVAELIGEGPPPPPSAAIDIQLLTDILAAIETHVQDAGEAIRPADKALVAIVLYDSAHREGRGKFVMDDMAMNILKLALKKPPRR
jgi:hypothetical protein